MTSSLTPTNLAALFAAMLVLAIVPSLSVLTVSARSAAYGLAHGVATTVGIIVGDILFILLAIFGLGLLAESFGELFVGIKILGGIYLIWLGTQLIGAAKQPAAFTAEATSSWQASFMAGLLITLGDQKAILFYLGFFPAFIDLTAITALDTAIIVLTAALAIAAAKLSYAIAAIRAKTLFGTAAGQRINRAAGVMIVLAGISIIALAGENKNF